MVRVNRRDFAFSARVGLEDLPAHIAQGRVHRLPVMAPARRGRIALGLETALGPFQFRRGV